MDTSENVGSETNCDLNSKVSPAITEQATVEENTPYIDPAAKDNVPTLIPFFNIVNSKAFVEYILLLAILDVKFIVYDTGTVKICKG